ncbi:FAD-binding protein [Campylobacter sp. 7477a]|uniref:FAD-binding protein n=1 Tax=Campylobacter sp. 7477a TaxID=2735741 RepID=UPI0030142843|nr:FAD-binding protein [Campylobacter sp. 7477a]
MSEQKFTRRDFLQSACISVGALAASGSGVSALAADNKKDSGNKDGLPSVDVLVIGSGGAGLRAAVAVRKKYPNLSVVVVNKGMPSRNATCMAEGGINGVIDFEHGDSHELHAYDTVKGSDFLGDQDAIIKFVEKATKGISSFGDIESLRVMAMKKGLNEGMGPAHAEAFLLDMVEGDGRLNEIKLALRSEGVLANTTKLDIAYNLMKAGKMNPLHIFGGEKIEGHAELVKMVEAARKAEKEGTIK